MVRERPNISCPNCKSDDIGHIIRGETSHKLVCNACDHGRKEKYALSFPKALATFDPSHPYLEKRKKKNVVCKNNNSTCDV